MRRSFSIERIAARALFGLAALAGLALASFDRGVARGQAVPTSSPQVESTPPILPSPKPTAEDPHVTKVAIQQFLAWQSDTVDRSLYDDAMNARLSDRLLHGSADGLARLGGLQTAKFLGVSLLQKQTFYSYRMLCEHGDVLMQFGFDQQGKIGLLYFK